MQLTPTPGVPTAPDKFVLRTAQGNVWRSADASPILFDTAQQAADYARSIND